MRGSSFEAVVGALDEAGGRYLVAGGLAVNAHGYLRFSSDADLVVELLPENVRAAWGPWLRPKIDSSTHQPSPILLFRCVKLPVRQLREIPRPLKILQYCGEFFFKLFQSRVPPNGVTQATPIFLPGSIRSSSSRQRHSFH